VISSDSSPVHAAPRGDLRAFERPLERRRDVAFRVTARLVDGDDEAQART